MNIQEQLRQKRRKKDERQWQMWRLAYVREKDTVSMTEIIQKEYNEGHWS